MSTLLIRNGTVVDEGAMRDVDLFVDGETVAARYERGKAPRADSTVDASGRYVLPGLIDAHLHPVYADRIGTLSRAALVHGVTTLIPYIGSVEAWGGEGSLVRTIENFIREGEATSHTDFSVHATLTRNVLDEAATAVPALVRRGVVSFKGFTTYRARGMKLEDDDLISVMGHIARAGGMLAVHAENDALLVWLERKALAEGRSRPVDFPGTHPPLSEAEAVFRVLALASETKCPLYLPHISCAQSLDVIELFRAWGLSMPLWVETCPHYLSLTEEVMERYGNLAKMSPPLRRREDVERLWRAAAEGRVDVVASDAAGHAKSAKAPLFGETFRSPYGVPGVESLLSVVWSEGVNKNRIAPPDAVRLLAEGPARAFGIYPRKGTLQAGSDADILILDPQIAHTVPETIEGLNVDYSVFSGWRCLGAPERVFLRGRMAYDRHGAAPALRDGRFIAGAPVSP